MTPHHVHTKALQALIIFALASSLILAGCGGVSTGSSDDSMLDILVLTPLSGPAAALGQTGKDAFTAAAKVVDKEGGILNRKVKLTFKDDRFDPVTAQQTLKESLNSDNRPDLFFPGQTSRVAAPLMPSSGLAPIVVDEVFAIVRDLRAEGYAIVLMEQQVESVLNGIADDIVIIDQGRMVLADEAANVTLEQIIQATQHGAP